MNKSLLKKYAQLAVRKGVNVQKGQVVRIRAAVDQEEFVLMLAAEAYKAGASRVDILWMSQKMQRLRYAHESVKTMSRLEEWEKERLALAVKEVPCSIYVLSDDPDGLARVSAKKLRTVQTELRRQSKPYSDALDNHEQWLIIAAPGKEWARKVFPGMRTSTAVEKLWELILSCVRVTPDGDAVQEWTELNERFARRCERLNGYRFTELHYTSANGTDFTVGMNGEGMWLGGSERTLEGIEYNPNMPSEEIFTSPMKGEAEGKIVFTMPLSYNGKMVENFTIEFENGKAVRWEAEKGKDVLDGILGADEGAAMLGEVALVGGDSPIRKHGVLFYETLFDENASCHIAVGRGFTNTIRGFENKTLEELHAMGVNDSLLHVDMMMGSDDMSITGKTADGNEIEIFRNGNWVF